MLHSKWINRQKFMRNSFPSNQESFSRSTSHSSSNQCVCFSLPLLIIIIASVCMKFDFLKEHFDFTCESRTTFHLLGYEYGYLDEGYTGFCGRSMPKDWTLSMWELCEAKRTVPKQPKQDAETRTGEEVGEKKRGKKKRRKIIIPTTIPFPK